MIAARLNQLPQKLFSAYSLVWWLFVENVYFEFTQRLSHISTIVRQERWLRSFRRVHPCISLSSLLHTNLLRKQGIHKKRNKSFKEEKAYHIEKPNGSFCTRYDVVSLTEHNFFLLYLAGSSTPATTPASSSRKRRGCISQDARRPPFLRGAWHTLPVVQRDVTRLSTSSVIFAPRMIPGDISYHIIRHSLQNTKKELLELLISSTLLLLLTSDHCCC